LGDDSGGAEAKEVLRAKSGFGSVVDLPEASTQHPFAIAIYFHLWSSSKGLAGKGTFRCGLARQAGDYHSLHSEHYIRPAPGPGAVAVLDMIRPPRGYAPGLRGRAALRARVPDRRA
jgi:hypothetical protein